mgnify:CR=1 FL=1
MPIAIGIGIAPFLFESTLIFLLLKLNKNNRLKFSLFVCLLSNLGRKSIKNGFSN